jgi:hypothetical protein
MYEIDLQSIRFSNGKRYKFPAEIAETLEFEESIIVRLASDPLGKSQNVYGLDWRGNLLWKIPSPRSFDVRSPYVGLSRKGSFVEALNWDGHILTLHPMKGNILAEDYH